MIVFYAYFLCYIETIRSIRRGDMKDFERYLKEKELGPATIEKYTRDIANYRKWEKENYKETESMSREKSCAWKAFLLTRSSAPSTINAAIAAVNAYADFMQKPDCRLKYVKTQRRRGNQTFVGAVKNGGTPWGLNKPHRNLEFTP